MGKDKEKRLTGLDVLMNDITGKHSKRMNALLMTLDDEDFMVAYFKGLEYAAPKLQRTELLQEEQEMVVTINHVNPEKE